MGSLKWPWHKEKQRPANEMPAPKPLVVRLKNRKSKPTYYDRTPK